MGYKLGALVSYNNENWVIIDMVTKQITDGNLYFLKIKNILTQEIISVDSRMVSEVNSRKKEINNGQIGEDTSYIQSLFDEVGNMDTDDFFDLDSQKTFDLSEVEITDETKNNVEPSKTNLSQLVENFQIPESKIHLTPRRTASASSFESVTPVNETLSNMEPIGEINTREFTPTRLNNQKTNEVDSNLIQNHVTNSDINIQPSRLKQAQVLSQSELSQPIIQPKSQVISEVKPEIIEEKRMVNEQIFNKYNEPVQEAKFEENLNEFVPLNTEKAIVENVDNKANKFKEQHFDALTTGPLNTKKLFESFNKQQKIQRNLDDNFKNNSDTKTDSTLFGIHSNFDKNALKDSKIYRKFRIMSSWLIALFTTMLIIPFIYIFMKLSYSWLETGGTIEFKQLIIVNLSSQTGIVYFIADIILVAIFPLWFAIFATYLIVYLVSVNDKQYKKIAFYNFQLENKISVIDSIQEYNNESSVYLIKVHNDMKKLKKDVKDLKDNSNIKNSLNQESRINIPH